MLAGAFSGVSFEPEFVGIFFAFAAPEPRAAAGIYPRKVRSQSRAPAKKMSVGNPLSGGF
jgi:hypothetical protein